MSRSTLPEARFRSGPRRERQLSKENVTASEVSSKVQNHENVYQIMPKGCQNASQSEAKWPTWSQKGTKMKPKWANQLSKTSIAEQIRKSIGLDAFPGQEEGVVLSKSINKLITNHSQKRSPQNMEFDTKGMPKWCPNRCQNSSKIDAQIGNEKNH